MALIYCPECGHEISNSAVACPNCGRPLSARPVVEKNVVVADPTSRRDGFPKWALIPIILIGALLLGVIFIMMTRDNTDADANMRVNVNTQRPDVDSIETSRQSAVNTTLPPMNESQSIDVPGSQTGVSTAPPTKGSIVIDAKIATRSGQPQAVKNERFYLLDKDLETILNDAGIEPIEGQSMATSLGLSVLYPERYGDFNRRAMSAIREHIKYAGTTDSDGKAELGEIDPNTYYLFGVTKAGKGFAIWSSPVSVIPGENRLNLTPQRLTEIELTSGE